jgi:alpha-L-fucosidase
MWVVIKLVLLLLLLPSHWCTASNQQEPTIGPVNPDYRYASASAVERWHDMKFGLRIHWGLYAAQGIGQESWPLFANKPLSDEGATIYWLDKLCGAGSSANGTGCQAYEQWYYAQANSWRPTGFDAAQWIALMNRAGVKYFDFTAKHCEGYSMYETDTLVRDCWDWDTTGNNPPGINPCTQPRHYSSHESMGRDFVGELISEARKGGILPGLYFSHADWHDPNLRLDSINPVVQGHVKPGCVGAPCDPQFYNRSTSPESWERGVLRHRAQLLELLTKYGELFELSLDVGLQSTRNRAFNADMQQTIMEMRAVAPNTLFRQRGIGGTQLTPTAGYGDYSTPEEHFPSTGIPGNWQVIYHGTQYHLWVTKTAIEILT